MIGDCLEVLRGLPDGMAQACVTSPPYYGLRDYGHAGQIGLEETPDAYVARLVGVFREVRRVLRDDGTLWLNLGDSYSSDSKWGGSTGGKHVKALHGDTGAGRGRRHTGMKDKDLLGIPWMVAFALRADGWWLRQDIIWHKPNAMPESVTDRCTKSHEYVFLLSKSARYYYDADAISEPVSKGAAGSSFCTGKTATHQLGRASEAERADADTRNRRDVWTIATQPFHGAHFAVMPPALVEPCILAGCPKDGVVLDPFTGSGTVGEVALLAGRQFVGIELNPEYHAIAERRIRQAGAAGHQPDLFAGLAA